MKKSFSVALTIDIRGESQSDIKSVLKRFEAKLRSIAIVEKKGQLRVTALRPGADLGNEIVRDRVRTFLERLR